MPDLDPAVRALAEAALDAAGVADAHLAALQQAFADPAQYHDALAFARLHLPGRDAPGLVGQALWRHTVLLLKLHEARPDVALELAAIAAEALVRLAIAQHGLADGPTARTE